MPCKPRSVSAERTSSSLNGLMMAVTSFMWFPLSLAPQAQVRAKTALLAARRRRRLTRIKRRASFPLRSYVVEKPCISGAYRATAQMPAIA
jgi:hypothetical protein